MDMILYEILKELTKMREENKAPLSHAQLLTDFTGMLEARKGFRGETISYFPRPGGPLTLWLTIRQLRPHTGH